MDEDDVQTAISKGNASLQMKRLINTGVFVHNVTVVQAKEGIFIPARGSHGRSVEDYVPCQFCLLMFVRHELYRHCQECKLRTGLISDIEQRSFISDGKAMFDAAVGVDFTEVPELLRKQVLYKMRLDSITAAVKKDPLILSLGMNSLARLGPRRANDIAQQMRQIGRLCLRLQRMKNLKNVKIADFLSGDGFDAIIAAIDEECESYVDASGRRLLKNPYVALKIGLSLTRLGSIKKGQAIRKGDGLILKEAEDYLSLHASEFTDRVSSPALASQRLKVQTLHEFPDEHDLNRLKLYLLKMMAELTPKLMNSPAIACWRHLAEVVLTRLIVFNGRRGSEAAELRIDEYRKKTNQVDPSIAKSMSDLEQKLLTR